MQTASQFAAGVGTLFSYDRDGNLISKTNHFGCLTVATCTPGVSRYWYDGANHLVEVQQPTNAAEPSSFERFLYDFTDGASLSESGVSFKAFGNLYAQQKNYANSFLTVGFQAYDALDRVSQAYSFPPCPYQPGASGAISCNNTPVATTFSYDGSNSLGELSSVKDPLGETSTFAYDDFSRLDAIQYAGDGGATAARTFQYDADNRVTALKSGNQTVNYSYDLLGNVTADSDALGLPSQYRYYGDGSLMSVTVPTLNNLTIGQSYGAGGRLQSKQYQYGAWSSTIAYSYTSAGQLRLQQDVTQPSTNYTFGYSYSYDQFGRAASNNLPEVSFAGFAYDLEDNVSSYQASYAGSVGNIQNFTRSYDPQGSLIGENVAAFSNPGVSLPSSYSFEVAQGVLVQSASEEWDARTNAILGFSDGSGRNFSYDAASRLVSAASGTNAVTRFSYDAENRQLTGTTTNFSANYAKCFPGHLASGNGDIRYNWGPDSEISGVEGSSLNSLVFTNWHNILGQFLYATVTRPIAQTAAFGTELSPQGIHVGSDATIGFTPQGQPQLSVNDRDLFGTLSSAHNTTGFDAWNSTGSYLQGCTAPAITYTYPGYVPSTSDNVVEVVPGLLFNGSSYVNTSDATILSPATEIATVPSGTSRRWALGCGDIMSARRSTLDEGDGCDNGAGGGGSNAPAPNNQCGGPCAQCDGCPLIGKTTGSYPAPSAPDQGDDGGGFGGVGGFGGSPLEPGRPVTFPEPPPQAIPPYKQIGHVVSRRHPPLLMAGLGSVTVCYLYYATCGQTGQLCYWGITCNVPVRSKAHGRVGRIVSENYPFPRGLTVPEMKNVETYMMQKTGTLQPGVPGFNQIRSISPTGVNAQYFNPAAAASVVEEMGVEIPELPIILP